MINLYDQWEKYLDSPETKEYLKDKPEAHHGWIPRWMFADFIRIIAKEQNESRP